VHFVSWHELRGFHTLNVKESRLTLCQPARWQVGTSGKSPALIHSELALDNIASLCRRSATNETYYPHQLMAPSRGKMLLAQ
jgi:hypothetical protein